MQWRTFLRAPWSALMAADFFTTEVWTVRGLVTYYTVFVIELQTRRVHVLGSTPYPDEEFVIQTMRHLTDPVEGRATPRMLHSDLRPRSEVECRRSALPRDCWRANGGQTPFRAPNCNAYAERCAPRRRREEKRDVTQLPHCSFAAQEMRSGLCLANTASGKIRLTLAR